jgi:hypothetical protein
MLQSRAFGCLLVVLALVTFSPELSAQQQPAPPPPGAYPYPYPYPYPPPGPYPYPYPHQQPPPPAPKPPPRELKYVEGESAPSGYRYDESARRGPIVAGALVAGIPYVIGLYVAAVAGFENSSGWLAVPVLGPWTMIATRDYGDACDSRDEENRPRDGLRCLGETWLVMLLVLDGMMQTGGAALITIGYAAPKKRWIREDAASLQLSPMRVGSGYGLGLNGAF